MTREELILYGKDYLHDLETACCKIEEKHKEFVRESIKALEQESSVDAIKKMFTSGLLKDCEMCKVIQESILDKIRADVERKIVKRPWFDFEDRERDRNDAFLEVLDIIDKYKVEMENNK